MGLIEDAISEVKAHRAWRNGKDMGLRYPTTPKAWRETFYLQLRQDIYTGVRVVTKTITIRWYRSPAHQILIQALTDIFQYGYSPTIIKPYNDLLDKLVGYH